MVIGIDRMVFLVLSHLLLVVAIAGGQQRPADTTRSNLRDSITLPPVLVTATRYVEPLTRVPYAVSVATPPDVQSGLSFEEMLESAPGLQVDNRYNFAVGERIAARGIGARTQFGVRGM